MLSSLTDKEVYFERERALSLGAYRATLKSRYQDITEASSSSGPNSKRWDILQGEFQSAKSKCDNIFAQLGRLTDAKSIPHWLIFLLAIAFAVLEAPINKFMLDNVLQGNNFDSYAASLFMTLIMLLLAHVAGSQLRQIRGAYEGRWYWGKIVMSALLIIVLGTIVGALTIGRAYYSTAGSNLPSSDIFSEIKSQILNVGLWTAFMAALADKAAFFLATMNIAGIMGAIILAFISVDSDPVYQSALVETATAKRKLERMAVRYDAMRDKIAKKYSRRLSNLATSYGAQNAEVIALKKARMAPLTDEDRLDITTEDQFRDELAPEAKTSDRRIAQTQQTADPDTVSQVVTLDRKALS